MLAVGLVLKWPALGLPINFTRPVHQAPTSTQSAGAKGEHHHHPHRAGSTARPATATFSFGDRKTIQRGHTARPPRPTTHSILFPACANARRLRSLSFRVKRSKHRRFRVRSRYPDWHANAIREWARSRGCRTQSAARCLPDDDTCRADRRELDHQPAVHHRNTRDGWYNMEKKKETNDGGQRRYSSQVMRVLNTMAICPRRQSVGLTRQAGAEARP